MSIKSQISEVSNRTPKSKYPYLGISNTRQTIMLFTSPGEGVVVAGGAPGVDETIGKVYDQVSESWYTPFEGTVSLSNLDF